MRCHKKSNGTAAEIYEKLSRSTIGILLISLNLISYVTGVRPLIISSSGIYVAGMVDALLIVAFIVAFVFYFLSKIEK
jgi:hypothetical protein